jgi:hypothetical protein
VGSRVRICGHASTRPDLEWRVGVVDRFLGPKEVYQVSLHQGTASEEGEDSVPVTKRHTPLFVKRDKLRKVHSRTPHQNGPRLTSDCVSSLILKHLLKSHGSQYLGSPFISGDPLVLHVLSFLTIKPICMSEVTALECSSKADSSPFNRYQFSAEGSLTPCTSSCWISAPNTVGRDGISREWLLYQLAKPTIKDCQHRAPSNDSQMPSSASGSHPSKQQKGELRGSLSRRQVNFVTMCLPSMPRGPLAVRVFHLEGSDSKDGPFTCRSPDFVTSDVDEPQVFAVCPPLEAKYIRLCCTENATGGENDCIGFWYCAFA